VEWWDGIGGQMVVARQRQAATKPRGAGSQKQAAGRGTKQVSKSAGKTLEDHCEVMVKWLLAGTLYGDASSARLLFSLAEGQSESEAEGVIRTLRSLASELAAEPEWKDGEIEASAEASLGEPSPAI